jgi:hypothetical protein
VLVCFLAVFRFHKSCRKIPLSNIHALIILIRFLTHKYTRRAGSYCCTALTAPRLSLTSSDVHAKRHRPWPWQHFSSFCGFHRELGRATGSPRGTVYYDLTEDADHTHGHAASLQTTSDCSGNGVLGVLRPSALETGLIFAASPDRQCLLLLCRRPWRAVLGCYKVYAQDRSSARL